MRKRRAPELPVTPRSLALFRLGEQCNHRCPMCSNSGRPEAFSQSRDELLERLRFLIDAGFSRVILTGGEPTIHPAFWDIARELNHQGLAWDINTHGRRFAEPGFAARAVELGLQRAIVSLHSHVPAVSALISGIRERAHHEILAGIDAVLAQRLGLVINCVLTAHNTGAGHLDAFVDFCRERFGRGYTIKLAFPMTTGKGGGWPGVADLTYSDVRDTVRALRERSRPDQPLVFESFPNCVLDDPEARNISRSGFGETHYLDDISGDRLYPIRAIEAALSCYPERCRGCAALKRCPGVAEAYARRHGVSELTPFSASSAPGDDPP